MSSSIVVSSAEIRAYLRVLQKGRDLCDASVNHAISEIRFLYEAVLGLEWNPKQVPHRKIKRCLPYFPDRDAVETFYHVFLPFIFKTTNIASIFRVK